MTPGSAIYGTEAEEAFSAAWRDEKTTKTEEVAERFGVTRVTLSRTAKRLGLPPRRRGPKPQRRGTA